MSVPELLVCGSLTLDNVVTADGTLLPQGAAGNVVYAALGAALWAGQVGMVSRAGADFPAEFLAMLGDHGLDLAGIARIDAPHGMNVAFAYKRDGSRVRTFPAELMARIPAELRPRFTDYTTRGMAHRFATWLNFAPTPSDIPAEWLAGTRGAHLAAMPVQRQSALARALRDTRPDRHLQLDSPWYDERDPDRDFHTALLRDIDLLLPSEADLATWRPARVPMQAAIGLARDTGRRLVVKRGRAGSRLVAADGRRMLDVPAFPVTDPEPTGAGDAFCGGVLAGMRHFGALREALACGAVSASFAVQAPGLRGLLDATRAEAERRLAWIAERMTAIDEMEEQA